MKRFTTPMAALLISTAALAGCAKDSEPTVAAAFYPLAWSAERVAGDHYHVENLTQPGQEPHDLEVDVATTATLAEADLVIYERDFQPAVDASVDENAEGEVLDVADAVELRPMADHDEHAEHADEGHGAHEDEGHEEHADEAHDHGDSDPHFWQDPLLMADLTDATADRLAEIDPDNAEDYRANAAKVREELETLDGEYADTLANCERDTVVVSHDAFGYLGRYGLHLEPIAGLSPDAEPTPADLAHLNELIKEEGITTVFSESLASPELAQTLASDTGVETAVLDPIEGLSDQTEGEDYLSLMRQNLSALAKANDCN